MNVIVEFKGLDSHFKIIDTGQHLVEHETIGDKTQVREIDSVTNELLGRKLVAKSNQIVDKTFDYKVVKILSRMYAVTDAELVVISLHSTIDSARRAIGKNIAHPAPKPSGHKTFQKTYSKK